MNQDELNRIFLFALVFGLAISGVALGWANPTVPPPEGDSSLFAGQTGQYLGNFGVGTSTPLSKLTVAGNASIGSGYIGVPAPENGLIVEGDVGIGESDPLKLLAKLTINGGISLGNTLMRGLWNSRIPLGVSTTTVPGESGRSFAMALGRDGYPLLAFYDPNGGTGGVDAQFFTKCSSFDCNSIESSVIIEEFSSSIPSNANAVVVTPDGLPIMAYNNSTQSAGGYGTRVAKCNDLLCLSSYKVTVHDNAVNPSIYVAAGSTGGKPMLAFFANFGGGQISDMLFMRCTEDDCSDYASGGTYLTLDNDVSPGVNTGVVTLMAGYDGNPILLYRRNPGASSNKELRFIQCLVGDCTSKSGPHIIEIGTDDIAFRESSLTINPNGLPIFSYVRVMTDGTRDLVVIACSKPDCSCQNNDCINFPHASSTIFDGSAEGELVNENSITIGADGLPLIVFRTASQTLYTVKCGNESCSSGANTVVKVDDSTRVQQLSIVTNGADGLPVTAYRTQNPNTMVILKCGSNNCLNYWTRR